MTIEPTPEVDEPDDDRIDFEKYVDSSVQALRIWDYAAGDETMTKEFQGELLYEQSRGWCNILFMDERVAIVQWHDQFVLTLNEDHPLVSPMFAETGAKSS